MISVVGGRRRARALAQALEVWRAKKPTRRQKADDARWWSRQRSDLGGSGRGLAKQAQRRGKGLGNPPTPLSVARPGQQQACVCVLVCACVPRGEGVSERGCEAAIIEDRYQMRGRPHTMISLLQAGLFAAEHSSNETDGPRDDADRNINNRR